MFKTGIELVTGVPGSGKSFFIVERLVDWILKDKRPVYTNLPLRHRVLKKYLKIKGGEYCAGLIHTLKEDAFNKFLVGFGNRQKCISDAMDKGTSRSAAIKAWESQTPDWQEWWIPAGSIIAIDEAHHWYPNPALSNVRKREPESLMTYLTMHRHGQYLVVFVTQADRQVSTTVKSLIATRYEVRRWDREPLIGSMTMEFINFPILKYDEYMGEDDPEQTKPIRSFTRLPRLPWYQIYFRLYESFTHAGGRHEALREVNKKRLEAGLEIKVPKQHIMERSFRWIFRWIFRVAFVFIIALLGFKCGSGVSEPEIINEEYFTISGVSMSRVYLTSGSEVMINDSYKGVKLIFVHPNRSSYWSYKDEFFTMYIGDTFNPTYSYRLQGNTRSTTTDLDDF